MHFAHETIVQTKQVKSLERKTKALFCLSKQLFGISDPAKLKAAFSFKTSYCGSRKEENINGVMVAVSPNCVFMQVDK